MHIHESYRVNRYNVMVPYIIVLKFKQINLIKCVETIFVVFILSQATPLQKYI